jgi:hypothetical protein
MNILIYKVRHKDQRYDTVGDWRFVNTAILGEPGRADLTVTVSEMNDWRYELLVGVHELIEAALCKQRGISGEAVDAFDKGFAKAGEPGDDPACPYRREHFFATSIEWLLAAELGVDWDEYDAALEAL